MLAEYRIRDVAGIRHLATLHNQRIDALLETPIIIAWAMLLGGFAIIAVEKLVKQGRHSGLADLPWTKSLSVGFLQCLAMIPGVSRSGATIMGDGRVALILDIGGIIAVSKKNLAKIA